ncbi:MAG: hypothetical protein HUU35_14065 [Armatimonadetes bacterium]|nr:hypothetical protein [Armatimonadota bacterium]
MTAATSVLWPLLAVITLFGVRPLRPSLGLGSWAFAGGCFYLAANGAGNLLWLAANAVAAVGLGWLVLKRER